MKLQRLQKKILIALTTDQKINLDADLVGGGALALQQRWEIYKNNITAKLCRILRETYQVVCKLVGEDFFNAMASMYVGQTPSLSRNILYYGASFSQFIKTFPYAQSLPYLSDVAAMEWAWHIASYGNSIGLDVQALAKIAEAHYSQIVFKLQPQSTLLSSIYPIYQIWQYNQVPIQDESTTIDLNSGGVCLYIWRQALDVRIDILQPEEWEFMSAMREGLTVGELCESGQWDVEKLLETCVKRGWIGGFIEKRYRRSRPDEFY